MNTLKWLALVLLGACLWACGASDGPTSTRLGEGIEEDDSFPLPSGDGDLSDPGPPPPIVVGEEQEAPKTFQPPVVSGQYLWSPNPESGKVALIHAETLATRILSAGLLPTYLAAIPSDEFEASAIVLNVGTSDATFFQVSADAVHQKRMFVHEGANRWAISPSGRFAVAFSLEEGDALDPTEGLQEVSIIDLSVQQPQARRLAVGARPSFLAFDSAETELIAVSRYGVELVELLGEKKRWVPLGQGEGRDVSITRDGSHALVRRSDQNVIEIVALSGSNETTTLSFAAPVTDLDLSPEGRAVAVVRDTSEVATFLVEEVIADQDRVDRVTLLGEIVGSAELTTDGHTAVLYTNASDSARVSVVNLEPGADYLTYRTFDTQTPVFSVRVSPDGGHAVVQAKGTEGSSAGAFSLINLKEQRFPRVFGTGAPIAHVDLGNHYGVVTATDAKVSEAHLITLASLQADTVALASAPLSAGIFETLNIGFAAQNHPEGRVTFFEFEAGGARTLTGFELSSEIVQE